MDNHNHSPSCGCKEYLNNEQSNDLLGSIDVQAIECLNEVNVGSCQNVFHPQSEKLLKDYFIESDIDSELMVIIPFIETVRIKIINIIAYDEGSSPNLLQVYINKQNVDFQLLEEDADEKFQIFHNLSGDQGCATRLSKFENVNEIVLHISSYVNNPVKISYIGIYGIKTQMKRKLVNTTYELIPLPREIDVKKQNQFNVC